MTTEIAESEQVIVSRVPTPLTRPNVSIVGFAEGHLMQAPFDDDSFEMWGINRLHTNKETEEKKWHRWFNLHDLEKFHGEDKEHLAFLKEFDGPVYLRAQDLGKFDIPNAVPFPADELVANFGGYFNNTISWLIAFAIALEPKELGLFGVDMAQDALLNAEYAAQRPSCEYFLGLASGRGITINLPKGSDLLKSTHGLYGFDDPDVFTQKLMNRLEETGGRKEKLKAELAAIDNQRAQMIAAVNQLDGAMQDVQYWLRNWVPQPPGEAYVESPNGKAN